MVPRSLFILCTAHCTLLLASTEFNNKSDLSLATSPTSSLTPTMYMFGAFANATNIVYVTSNVIADIIFIFRCYAIWNFRRRVVVIPVLCTLAVAGERALLLEYIILILLEFWVIGTLRRGSSGSNWMKKNVLLDPTRIDSSLSPGLFGISIMMSLLTTFILMGLSAGRIWWLARTARQVLGGKLTSRYYVICAMILESGAMYSVGGVIFIAILFSSVPNSCVVDITGGAVLGQLVGLAPTIIAVRVGLGQSVESVGSFVATEHSRAQSGLEFQATTTHQSIEHRVIRLGPDREDEPEKTETV
ncbi:hypothetical protein MVEN_02213600 [Mycena venus]|uniref:Uncharacterized protein n=1 Tax=Mycena venus TaxID=2733690 RepID=A0A8H7CHG7_9AGAR|nr:hypothetical protein MVEN_02213600 [Mycena venus]